MERINQRGQSCDRAFPTELNLKWKQPDSETAFQQPGRIELENRAITEKTNDC